jgi:hypothetical protein
MKFDEKKGFNHYKKAQAILKENHMILEEGQDLMVETLATFLRTQFFKQNCSDEEIYLLKMT